MNRTLRDKSKEHDWKYAKCKCKINEFCDICLNIALETMIKRGYLKRVKKDGEHAWVNA